MKDILLTTNQLSKQFQIKLFKMSSNKKQQKFQTPFCKVCYDAGKSENEYTSHYVRSEQGANGKVVCPTLLTQECGYCGACGHTPKFCQVLTANKATELKVAKQAARVAAKEKKETEQKKQSPVKKMSTNIFAAFSDDDDDILEVPKQFEAVKTFKIEEFPALTTTAKKTVTNNQMINKKPSFLSALNKICPDLTIEAKMPEVTIAKPMMAKLVRKGDKEDIKPEIIETYEDAEEEDEEVAYITSNMNSYYYRPAMKASEMDWAALESSDDDEDEDDEDW